MSTHRQLAEMPSSHFWFGMLLGFLFGCILWSTILLILIEIAALIVVGHFSVHGAAAAAVIGALYTALHVYRSISNRRDYRRMYGLPPYPEHAPKRLPWSS